ncbi:hypothetical protein Pth03_11740 [Planotetraspora thailandica]|uniref:Restriction endonuclease type IV Mrr domain-containing protein n=1 Tax=Planotetraspora thailandica TaxID=487172 RepID=A0A8J3V9Y0_9ACTN|nr:restriction endonuclease [Planotetraspora thailandica]GII52785.1 hypothetical protein Pth03_11740 [Planotetraspora thailandica]
MSTYTASDDGDDPPINPYVALPKLDELPFQSLSPKNFERLVRSIAREVDKLRGAQLYGISGQRQDGLDVIGESAGAWHGYQAKKVGKFQKKDLIKALDTFIDGSRPFGVKRLVIVTACSIGTQVQKELAAYQKQNPDLVLELWDAERLNETLRGYPQIVARFFGDCVAKRFCDLGTWDPAIAQPCSCTAPEARSASRADATGGCVRRLVLVLRHWEKLHEQQGGTTPHAMLLTAALVRLGMCGCERPPSPIGTGAEAVDQ